MYSTLFLAIVFCLFFATSLSIRCFEIVDSKCLLKPDVNDCGDNGPCVCFAYSAKCEEGDLECTDDDIETGIVKWRYGIIGKDLCTLLKDPYYEAIDAECCSTDGCNRPRNAECGATQIRRRILRKFNDLFQF
ncbi:unnamed protein product [Rotaria sp. Silwood1]|nr:unnamed protein product [Rotaria sp. Silwood1]CAF1417618.1 unnamed protein product [Rotaria sp. Silwood1]CAF1430137.1 unnamed protein product [Rotaria sp. Silwood1]CAF3473595.1 unnamed protein product [Rotaria sp. Silwood1]CAF3567271.1 unnamed protein product [Rotaria sp. Silwood1]